MRALKIAVGSFMLAAIFLLAATAGASEPFKERLENGLTVVIQEEHAAPVVAIEVWVNVGGADETDKEAGISHVFEHMLFKGTSRRAVGEIAGLIESVGGDINAYTSFDRTVYHLVVPSSHFATGLDVLADAVMNSKFDASELKKELQVVLEEIRMNEDSPERSLYKSVFAAAYSKHPYKRPVIGFKEVVESITREQMLAFHRKWYSPVNMTLVIAGDVDKDEALKAVTELFKGFKPRRDAHKKRPAEPEQKALKSVVMEREIKEAHLAIAFHIPGFVHEDTAALDVASAVLGSGETSRLYKRLKLDEVIVRGVSAYAMTPKDPGLLLVTARLDADKVEKAAREAVFEIRRLAAAGPNPDELARVKTAIESGKIYSRETMQGIADTLGYYQSATGDLEYEKEYLDAVRGVTPADVRDVLERYLTESSATVVALVPKGGVLVEADSGRLAAALSAAFADAAAKYPAADDGKIITRKARLDNGMTVIVKETHASPTVAFYAAFPGGLRFEGRGDNGVGNFTALMLTKGTRTRTRAEISRAVEDMAAGLGGFSGWNSTGASAKFLSTDFDRGLELLADVLLNPTFPEEELEKERKGVLAAIKAQEDNLPSFTFKLLYAAHFTEHPYGMPVIGSAETVAKFKREELVAHHGAFFTPDKMVLTIVGDVPADYAVEKARAAFAAFKPSGAELKPPKIEEPPKAPRNTGAVREKAQVNIAIGFRGVPIGHEDSYPIRVMTEVLAGQGGRLFVNLRDRDALAYSVHAMAREGVDPGVWAVYMASAPEKRDAAIAGMIYELWDISTNPVTEAELKRAKGSLIGTYQIGLQEGASQASDMANNELYGLGYEFYRAFPAKIEAVTAADVMRVAKKYLTLDAQTLSIVGPDGKPKGATPPAADESGEGKKE